MNIERLRFQLVSAVTNYDRKQSTKRFYNPHALAISLERVDLVIQDIESGTPVRKALLRGFNDRLLDYCLKAVGELPFTKADMQSQSLTY